MIRHFNVLESETLEPVRLQFSRGLNCFTGETGTGKTVFLNLLANCLGLPFPVPENMDGIYEVLFDDGQQSHTVRLSISRSKKKFEMDGIKCSQRQVRELLGTKAVFSSQFESQTLDSAESLVHLLDSYAGLDGIRSDYSPFFLRLRTLNEELSQTRKNLEASERVKEALKEELEELRAFNPQVGEYEDLKNVLLKLSERDRIAAHLRVIAELVDDESAFLKGLFEMRTSLLSLSQFYEEAQKALTALDEWRLNLKSVLSLSVPEEANAITVDQINERLFRYEKYFRRYGLGEASILSRMSQLEEQLSSIERLPTVIRHLEEEISTVANSMLRLGQALAEARRLAVNSLRDDINAFLSELRIDGVLEWDWKRENDSPLGLELPALFVRRGENDVPVGRLSGGERSRIVFVLKVLLSPTGSVLIFDEPDAGIGGETLSRLVQILKRLSQSRQIVLITHNPQVAASAGRHYVVDRVLSENKVYVKIHSVVGEERVNEVAKMIAGQYVTATTLEQAGELIRKLSGGDFGE
ncbi:AAA family ATPase [Coprothermobacteraceae bacterium]|nr:AAA family ATPase [Coprothermobacteraceae bacterium]